MNTIEYYNKNSQSFYDRTINVDISDNYCLFLNELTHGAKILDAGCGVGRDSKYFLKQGYHVTAFDASSEMVKLASKETGLEVLHLNFHSMNFHDEFDGVWASASLLHISYNETREVYQKIHNALKNGGFLFATYKYGDKHMVSAERDFYNMTEDSILPYLKDLFKIKKIFKSADTRSQVAPGPTSEWLNIIAQKDEQIARITQVSKN